MTEKKRKATKERQWSSLTTVQALKLPLVTAKDSRTWQDVTTRTV